MSSALIEDQVEVHSDNDIAVSPVSPGPAAGVRDMSAATELGIWLSGLESFLAAPDLAFRHSDTKNSDHSKAFGLVRAALRRSLILTGKILADSGRLMPHGITERELSQLSAVFRNAMLLSDGLIRAGSLGPGEWKAWADFLAKRLALLRAFGALISAAEAEGRTYLPGVLRDLSKDKSFLSVESSEMALILPRFGVVLLWLDVIGRMLEADEPLKPTLLIFARINEQIFELTNHISGRLESFADQEAEMFSSLDAAAYTASIELRKVYEQELAGVAQMRPSPSIYARIETAYCLLKEGFQQMLASFAQLMDPAADVFDLFPSFKEKLDQSIKLRQKLWELVAVVQAAEHQPERTEIERMQADLRAFLAGPVGYLFYKDTETVERFVEEILVTKQNKDLVPLLHRFGAYLETLFGQVNLRSVLAKHPFSAPAATQATAREA